MRFLPKQESAPASIRFYNSRINENGQLNQYSLLYSRINEKDSVSRACSSFYSDLSIATGSNPRDKPCPFQNSCFGAGH